MKQESEKIKIIPESQDFHSTDMKLWQSLCRQKEIKISIMQRRIEQMRKDQEKVLE